MATFVLVHGAWHGAWCWRRVARLLTHSGHDVFAPTLTGLAERSHLLTSAVVVGAMLHQLLLGRGIGSLGRHLFVEVFPPRRMSAYMFVDWTKHDLYVFGDQGCLSDLYRFALDDFVHEYWPPVGIEPAFASKKILYVLLSDYEFTRLPSLK